jgi:hypothetical protein
MQRFQNRVLQIIGITKEVAKSKYNIIEIANHIEKTRFKQVNRILSNKGNELTASLLKSWHPEATTSTRSNFEFDIPIVKKEKFSNNSVIKTLKTLRDGRQDLYTNNNHSHQPPKQPPAKPTPKAKIGSITTTTTTIPAPTLKPKSNCENCYQPYIRFGNNSGSHKVGGPTCEENRRKHLAMQN